MASLCKGAAHIYVQYDIFLQKNVYFVFFLNFFFILQIDVFALGWRGVRTQHVAQSMLFNTQYDCC